MKRSNIFAHIELSRFVDELSRDPNQGQACLLRLHAYFNIIPLNMLSKELASEWDDICRVVSRLGPCRDADEQIVSNAVKNTIKQLTNEECFTIIGRVVQLQVRVATDF
jgi:hypothetical protein